MTDATRTWPQDFVWGVAASAYQTEGAVAEDGRGRSIWDTFCDRPGAIRDGTSGAVACDVYHRYRDDIALMRRLGVDAFRFSIAWPRVLPEGRGPVNERGLDFYDRFVDALLEAGILPVANLFHWDLPQALEDEGGWPARDTAAAFAEYAGAVAARLGDRVTHWTTHNEPYCPAWLGHVLGVHAPGRNDLGAGAAALHHLLLSHGLAVDVLRHEVPRAVVGIIVDVWPTYPATADLADERAARLADSLRNRLVLDPLLRGRYPADLLEWLGKHAPPVLDGDLRTISTPLDFLGLNNYSRTVVRAGAEGDPVDVPQREAPATAMGWEIYPDALHDVLVRVHRDYDPPPLLVTENGAAFADVVRVDGTIDDRERIAYLEANLAAVARAQAEGVPVGGYFVWSLLDNFEWSEGYRKRFGLVHVDYETLARTPKASFDWYAGRIAESRRSRAASASR